MERNGTLVKIPEARNCDFCKEEGLENEAKYDGKTIYGSWAYMCELHFKQFGIGLGIGRGQELEVTKRKGW
jgi:hypothetical protein